MATTRYKGPHPELREELRSIAVSNGRSVKSFNHFWLGCIRSNLSISQIKSKFDKSILSKKKGTNPKDTPEYQAKRREFQELAVSHGLTVEQYTFRWHNACSKHDTLDKVVEYLYKSITQTWSGGSNWERIRKLVISRGYFEKRSREEDYLNIAAGMRSLWDQWDDEDVDIQERERRISATKYGYKKDISEELWIKGLFPPFSLLSDPLSHLYQELATIAYNNDFTVNQKGKVIINATFRRWWQQCVDNNLNEEQRRQSFKDRGFDKPRKKLVHGEKTDEQKKAREWSYNLAKSNGYTEDDKPHLLPSKCQSYISNLLRNWTSLEYFKARITFKYGKPNFKNPTILASYLKDHIPAINALYTEGLDHDTYTNRRKRNAFLSKLTDIVGYPEVAVSFVEKMIQREKEAEKQKVEEQVA